MNPEIAIQVEQLSKLYHVGASEVKRAMLPAMIHSLTSPARRLALALQRKSPFAADATIWALKDISFEIKRGDVVGIVGSNGSGKSTLLKILSRITHPTEGVARINGAVGSLLEVGTGFHPELTGRENIYLNGAILGMSRWDINAVYDEIVEFSGVGAFLDTPVKRYSSGMRVRLAFSVAAFFKPEVLLVDEVLSVGDAEFQKRGLGRLSQVSNEGRTVILVSHKLSAILSHCDWVMWINKGRLIEVGEPLQVVSNYLQSNTASDSDVEGEKFFPEDPAVDAPIQLIAMRTLDQDGRICSQFISHTPIIIEFDLLLRESVRFLKIGFDLKTSEDITVFRSHHNDLGEILPEAVRGQVIKLRAVIPAGTLNRGTFSIDPLAGVHKTEWYIKDVRGLNVHVTFDVPNEDFVVRKRPGLVAPMLPWQVVEMTKE
ncbi:MAG: ABC transporter ATP-binding protein [Anaerolineae bacterium]|jgi:lipopolysaccharide transport system ATP-binding protein|nr:ABC transporter ATP-binding protein [Anaerolineae bacterium]